MASSKKVITNLIWRFLERFGAHLVTIVVSLALKRILGPTLSGAIALVTVITALFQVFVDSGLGNALIQKKDADDTDFSTVFYFNCGMCLVLYAILYFVAPFISNFYDMEALTPAVIRVLGLTIVISGLKNVQQAYVSKHLLFKKFFFSTLFGTISAAVTGLTLAILDFGIWALVAQYLVNLFIDTLVLWFTVKWRPKWLFSWKRLKGLFAYGWKLLASSMIDVLYKEARQLIIGKKYTPDDLAYYNQGQQIPNFLTTNINSSIDSVLLPTMAEEQDDKTRVKTITRRAIKTSSFIIWPMMVGLGVCAKPLVNLVLGSEWLFCVPYMRIFCFSYAFWPIHTANLNAIKAMGRSDLFLILEIIKKVVGIALILSSMWFGVLAMAYSLLISTILSSIINSFPNKKLLGYSYFEQMRDILPSILLSAIMGIVVYCIQFIGLHDIFTLLIQVPLGVLIYFTGAFLFKFESFIFILNIIKSFLGKERKKGEKENTMQNRKKILLLGGSAQQVVAIEKAKELGYYTVLCDYLSDNPGQYVADKFYLVSTTDKDAVLEVAKAEKVDGVLAYASDPAAPTAAYVAEQLSLPTNPYESVRILCEKDRFRAFLSENGFRTPKASGYQSVDVALDDLKEGKFKFPVIVKPVDSSGSKGVGQIDDLLSAKEKLEYAMSRSRNGRIIVEEYVEKFGYQIAGDGLSIDGMLVFRCFANDHFNPACENPFVPISASFPYNMPVWVQEKVHAEIQRLLTLLNMKTCTYNFDMRIDKEYNVYLMEVAPRDGGNYIPQLIRYSTGIDLVECSVKAALGEKILLPQTSEKGFWSYFAVHSLQNGILKSIEIDADFEKKHLVENHIIKKEGDDIQSFTGANTTLGILLLQFDSMDEMLHAMDHSEEWIKVVLE